MVNFRSLFSIFRLKLNSLFLIAPEKFFLALGLFFGLMFIVLTPPFQVPDETNHFFRAWQVSEGGLSAVKQDSRVGGFIPQSLVKFSTPFYYLKGNLRLQANTDEMYGMTEIRLDQELEQEKMKSRVLLQVHDELLRSGT